MKSIIASLVVMATVVSANALTFAWGTATTRVQFPTGTYVTDGSVTAYLVYLGDSAAATYSIDGYGLSNPTVDTGTSTVTGLTSTKGRITESFQQNYGSAVGSGTFIDGATFGLLLTHVDAGVTWYNLSSTKYTVSGAADDTSALNDAVFSFSFANNGQGTPLTSGGGWVAAPIPEPATAALALAGLAMLIRRRK